MNFRITPPIVAQMLISQNRFPSVDFRVVDVGLFPLSFPASPDGHSQCRRQPRRHGR
jgi:hypothetical protein